MVLVLVIALREQLQPLVDGPAVATWFSICIQALPFLGLGVLEPSG